MCCDYKKKKQEKLAKLRIMEDALCNKEKEQQTKNGQNRKQAKIDKA